MHRMQYRIINSHGLAAWGARFSLAVRAHLVPQQLGLAGVGDTVYLSLWIYVNLSPTSMRSRDKDPSYVGIRDNSSTLLWLKGTLSAQAVRLIHVCGRVWLISLPPLLLLCKLCLPRVQKYDLYTPVISIFTLTIALGFDCFSISILVSKICCLFFSFVCFFQGCPWLFYRGYTTVDG